MNRFARFLWIAAGTAAVGLGILGIVVPMMPATPFLLLAAFCYARGSKRFHDWLLGHRVLGAYIRAYREGRGLDRSQKAMILVLLWASFGVTMVYFAKPWWARATLAAIAIGVTIHIARMRGAAAETEPAAVPLPAPAPGEKVRARPEA